jgi:integrase/recombinase XerC
MNPDGDLIEAHLAHLAELGRSPKTIRTYGTALWAAHRELPYGLPRATRQELAGWLAGYPSAATRRVYLAAFRCFTRWALKTGHLDRDEAAQLHRPAPPRALPHPCTDGQLATILGHARQPCRLWSTLAAYAGLRCCEVAGLHREHATAESLRVLHGKGGRPRVVPTHPAVWQALEHLPPGPVAPGRGSDYISGRLRAEFLRLGCDTAAHELRHWYGTTLVASGAGLEQVRILMGHSSVRTTLGYVLVASPALAAAVARLPCPTLAP